MLKPLYITVLLFYLVSRVSAEKAFNLKFQDWNEDDDRIRVRSWYAEANSPIGHYLDIGIVGMIDTITGATPTGAPPTQNRKDWLANLEEQRQAGVLSFAYSIDDYLLSSEFGVSEESDYLSKSYAINASKGFAENTLTLSTGFSYLYDDVDSNVPGGPGLGILTRETPELFIGIHRIIDPKTTLSFNLTYGIPQGYLSDPYKQVGRTEPVFPGSTREELYLYPENRPNKRKTFVAYLEGIRYFEKIDASLEASYRYFTDDSDLSGHTMELKWFKRLGDYLVLRQLFRYYKQNAADFYRITLDGSGIEPIPQPDGSSPHYYSSDYRISKFEALTLGIKLTILINDNLSIDLSYDRYEMNGLDGQTSQLVYPSANVLTVGMQSLF